MAAAPHAAPTPAPHAAPTPAPHAAPSPAPRTLVAPTYEAEVDKAHRDIAAIAAIAERDPRDIEKRVRLAYRQYHRAVLTDERGDFAWVERSIGEMLRDFGPTEDVCLLKANVDGHFHRLQEVKEDLRLCPPLAARAAGRAIQADVDQQEGRYEAARETLVALVADHASWDDLARLAHWMSQFGARRDADQLYAKAEEELTAKELRSYAWLERARAELALSGGLLARAHEHAERASAAFPGHWKTLELQAKLCAAEGRLDQALARLTDASRCSVRPECLQAVGEVLRALGRTDEAVPWLERAERIYLGSVDRGEVHYLHHLADYYAGAGGNPGEAVRWARQDLALRENFATQTALAWALFRQGESSAGVDWAEGLHWAERALGSGVKDASLFRTAAALHAALGNGERAAHFERAAAELNPLRYEVHLHL